MKFEKKLIILTGEGFCKGAVSIEKNALGCQINFNSYNIPDLTAGCYFLVFKSTDFIFTKQLGKKGDISINFSCNEDIPIPLVHCMLVRQGVNSVSVVLYGSLNKTKLWQGNMLDGVNISPLVDSSQKSIENSDNIFSSLDFTENKKSNNKLSNNNTTTNFDKPLYDDEKNFDKPLYDDEKIATENYYPSNLFNEINSVLDKAIDSDNKSLYCEVGACRDSENNDNSISLLKRAYLKGLADGKNSIKDKIKNTDNVEDSPTQPKKRQLEGFTIPPITQGIPTYRKTTYYEKIKNDLDDLFANNERFSVLENLMPNTKWVKIWYDKSRYYVVGVIGEDYIAYGVPAKYSPSPPSEFEGFASFLPLKSNNVYGDGFWIMYQDAKNGDSIKI